MSTNYTGRVTFILIVLAAAVFSILPPNKLWNSSIPWSQKTALKPGIDIAGGTSLLYEIKAPPGVAVGNGNLAEKVAEALKKRVDPNGVRNLVWRPQGDTKLEIQIPRSPQADRAGAVREAYIAAGQFVDSTNLSQGEVLVAVEKLHGDARAARLKQMADGSAAREKLFGALRSKWDQIQIDIKKGADAEKAKDFKAQVAAAKDQTNDQNDYDALKKSISSTNLTSGELKTVLDLPAADKASQLAKLHQKFADFPLKLQAMDQYISVYAQYKSLQGAIDDASEVKALLKGSGVLEFHILLTPRHHPPGLVEKMMDRMKPGGEGPSRQGGDEAQWFLVDRAEEFPSGGDCYSATWNGKPYVLASIIPADSMVHTEGEEPWSMQSVSAGQDSGNGQQVVNFSFDPEGAKLFGDLTGAHIDPDEHARYRLAIVLDDRLISAPNLNSRIGGQGQISGGRDGFSNEELDYLVNTLAAGSLPAQLADAPMSERTVSPQLGKDNLFKGLVACAIGLVVVSVFLVSYYYLSGVVATIAVFMNLIIILGVLCMLDATFTMPSIAGIVLTVGTAVDANVLVFERLREEQHRGLNLRMALRNAYDRAFSAIVDSNMTTVITSFFLYLFGSEEVKGFGLTLLIGIASSLFTALFVTRTIFGIMMDHYEVRELHSIPTRFPKWDKFLRPNIDWMGMIWPFVAFSTVFVVLGLSAFWKNGRNMYDIEFASGTSVQFELKHDMTRAQVDALIEKENIKTKSAAAPDGQLPSPSVVSINNSKTLYEIVTPNDHDAAVRAAVLEALGDNLKIALPSKFDMAGQTVQEAMVGRAAKGDEPAMEPVVVPILSDSLAFDGVDVPDAATMSGGVAIDLRNISPPLSPKEIKDRFVRASVQPGSEQSLSSWKYVVDRLDGYAGPDADTRPTSSAAVVVSDENFPYAKSPGDWTEKLASPAWRLVEQGVDREARLQKVSNFNPQVAGDTQRDAFMATLMSIIVIMIYIWVRFGNLKYGTATVVALLHDTLITIGAVGLSHYLAGTAVGNALLIEPFRINLTLVAAILTVMGYSMIDTIVVFDRIRENRGKYGVVTRQVINDSVNQTLSRTLLTAGTTIITVAVMYICGGPGVHGFTFVLLVGILVGTYSSIAIAAPILLLGGDKQAASDRERANRKTPIGQTQISS